MTSKPKSKAKGDQPQLSVVVPVHNEADNLRPLIREIVTACAPIGEFEIVYVDDGSTDGTLDVLRQARNDFAMLRIMRHRTCQGQSAAVATGVDNARGPIIATLDGDGQNDPADIPKLLEVLRAAADPDFLLVAGWRAVRRDSWVKRWASRLANLVRAALLKDATPDSGCGLKLFTRAAFLDLPRFDHMHRFLPALMVRRGAEVASVRVNHRSRERGVSKYGVLDRALVGLSDLFGVAWLLRRGRRPDVEKDLK